MSQTQWPDWSPDDAVPPPPPGGQSGDSAGPPGWGAPPPPPSRRGWLVAAIIGAVIVGLGLVVTAGVLVLRSTGVDDPPVVATDEAGPAPSASAQDDPAVAPEDVADPRDAVTAELLEAIDESELAMIDFQIAGFDGIGEDGLLLDGGERLVVDAAREGSSALAALGDRLAAIEQDTGDAVTSGHLDIRDTYVLHLEAWRDYMDAVAADPSLLEFDNDAGDPFSEDIATTADDFVVALRRGLPDDTPPNLQNYADFIIERGFASSEGDDGELV